MADTLLNQLDDQLKVTEDECRDYRNFLERLESAADTEDQAMLDEELAKVQYYFFSFGELRLCPPWCRVLHTLLGLCHPVAVGAGSLHVVMAG